MLSRTDPERLSAICREVQRHGWRPTLVLMAILAAPAVVLLGLVLLLGPR